MNNIRIFMLDLVLNKTEIIEKDNLNGDEVIDLLFRYAPKNFRELSSYANSGNEANNCPAFNVSSGVIQNDTKIITWINWQSDINS